MGLNGDLPPNITFDYRPTAHVELMHALVDGERVGYIEARDGTVDQIEVEPQWQRRGIGTALFNRLKEQLGGNLQHTFALTNDGENFVQSIDPEHMERYDQYLESPEGQADHTYYGSTVQKP